MNASGSMTRTHSRTAGFSIVELLCAIAVASVAFVGTLQLYYVGTKTLAEFSESTIAQRAAINEIETLRAAPYDTLLPGEMVPFQSDSPEAETLPDRHAHVSIRDRADLAPGLKEVIATVQWTSARGYPRSRQAVTLIGAAS